MSDAAPAAEDGRTAAELSEPTTADARPVVSVVLPVYNEADNIPWVFDRLTTTLAAPEMNAHRPAEVIFVEDGSTDGTSQLIDEYAREHGIVRSIHLARQRGQSTALAAGFDHARGRVIVPMDADRQNDPADIPRLLTELDHGYDCVSGWRRDRHDPWHKRWPSAIQTWLAKRLGPDINDFGCTMKAYRAEALQAVHLWGEGHRYLPAQLYDRGYSIGEIEVTHRPREHGESRYGTMRLVRGFVDLLFYWFWNRYSTRPMHLLGGAGLALLALGGGIGTVSVIQRYAFGVALASKAPRLILVVLLLVFGLQLLFFGVITEYLTKLYYRDEQSYRVTRVVE